jgi:hypothetical protein
LRAAQLRFGNEDCKTVLQRVCHTFIEYGWWKDQSGQWLMADAFAWNDGKPLPDSAYPGPLVERNEGFEEWSWGAVKISIAILDSDRAKEILNSRPSHPTSSSDSEWLAVR